MADNRDTFHGQTLREHYRKTKHMFRKYFRSDREKSPSDLRQKVARKRDKKTGSESESENEKVSVISNSGVCDKNDLVPV